MDPVDSRCDESPGRTVPVIDRNRCEAKSDCVDVCEEKFKDDKPRVQCKMACIGDREKCEKECK